LVTLMQSGARSLGHSLDSSLLARARIFEEEHL
jgi:hypothetical protein